MRLQTANAPTTYLGLLLKALLLRDRVVELGVGVCKLLVHCKELEAFGEAGRVAMPLGERAHNLWVAREVGRVDESALEELADELVEEARTCARLRTLHLVLARDAIELITRLCKQARRISTAGSALVAHAYQLCQAFQARAA